MPARGFFRHRSTALTPARAAPWPVWTFAPRVHPILFVHRVAGLEPGLYALPRAPRGHGAVATASSTRISLWSRVAEAPDDLPLYLLKAGDARGAARRLFCNQAIASDCCFGMAMLAEFDAVVAKIRGPIANCIGRPD